MSNEANLISLKAWAEKHNFDMGTTTSFFIGRLLDGVQVKSFQSKVSEAALDSFKGDVLLLQKKVPHNKGQKKAKSEDSEQKGTSASGATLKKLSKKATVAIAPATPPVAKTAEPKEAPPKDRHFAEPSSERHSAGQPSAEVQKKELPKEESQKDNSELVKQPAAEQIESSRAEPIQTEPSQVEPSFDIPQTALKAIEQANEAKENEPKPQEHQQKRTPQPNAPAANTPEKKQFTATISNNIDPAILARIKKSQEEKTGHFGFRGGSGGFNRDRQGGGFKGRPDNRGAKPAGVGGKPSSTGYSGNLRAQPRVTENKAVAGGVQSRRPAFGTTLQDVLSPSTTPAHKGFLDNRTGGGTGGGGAPRGRDSGKGGRGKKGKDTVREREIQKENAEKAQKKVNSVLVSLSKVPVKKTYSKDKIHGDGDAPSKVIKVSTLISVGELAALLEQQPARVIGKCMEMGNMVTINKQLDFETVQIIADEFGYEAQLMDEFQDETLGIEEEEEMDLLPRHAVVTVMGHVDHGKTSLLDYIRKTNVVRGESGGITQHIGAYEVETPSGRITFLDTPGHEAFTAMRARGSQVTDVIVLVVAADSMVMPQTVEVINLAKTANVPIVVAITKIDLPTANTEKIMSQLSERGVQVEEWGGNVSCVQVSVKTGAGIDKLLETLALESEVLELKANPNTSARGTVVESRLDAGKGTIATILIQNGTLKVRDCFVCGNYSGRVRAMFNERGETMKEAGPSTPCQVLGFSGTPQAGDDMIVVDDDQIATEIATKRQQAAHERSLRFKSHMSLEQIYDKAKSGEFSELNLLIKTDVAGSCEALSESLLNLSNNEVKIKIIRKGVGAINDDDVHLASVSNAIIIAFHLMPSHSIKELAELEGVEIKTYRVIYDVIDEIKGAIEGLLKPVSKEEVTGEAEIRQVFRISKLGLIAGSMVKSGEVDRDSQVHVYRNGVELGVTKVQSLKRNKDDVSSVKTGLECGIGLRGYDNIQEGDVLIFFKQVTVARTLADVARDSKNDAKDGK